MSDPVPHAGARPRATKVTRLLDEKYRRDVLRAADSNHIWLNAFQCIRPTPEFCEQVGRELLRMLDNNANTHLSQSSRSLGLEQRELIVRVNKS